jgi:hypothetical protein
MGLKDYFHPVEKDAAPKKPAPAPMAVQRSTFSASPSLPPKKSHSKESSSSTAPNTVELSSITTPRPSLNTKSSHMSLSAAYPTGDFRNNTSGQIMDLKADVMANWLHHRQQERMWTYGSWDEGVILKKARDDYVCCPSNLLRNRNGFYDCVKKLNVKVCGLLILRSREKF